MPQFPDPGGEAVTLTPSAVATIAVEAWRIRRAIAEQEQLGRGMPGVAALRFAARSIERVLAELGVETVDFRGQPYQPGMCMVVEQVVNQTEREGMPTDQVVETIEPTVLLKGIVVFPGRVVVAAAMKEGPADA